MTVFKGSPSSSNKKDLNAWYDNQKARTHNDSIGNASRWGYFIEQIIRCNVGKRVGSMSEVKDYVYSLKNTMANTGIDNFENRTRKNEVPRVEYCVYMISVPNDY